MGAEEMLYIHTCDDIPVSVLHAVLIFLGRVPRCRLSLEKTLKKRGRGKQTEGEEDETWVSCVTVHLNDNLV